MSKNVWNKLANRYDRLWVQKYSLAPTRKKVISTIEKLNLGKNFTLLDFGCATGQLIEDLLKMYPQADYYGFDKSYQMIEMAKNKNLNCNFSVQCATNIEFNQNYFDIVTCCHSFYNKTGQLIL